MRPRRRRRPAAASTAAPAHAPMAWLTCRRERQQGEDRGDAVEDQHGAAHRPSHASAVVDVGDRVARLPSVARIDRRWMDAPAARIKASALRVGKAKISTARVASAVALSASRRSRGKQNPTSRRRCRRGKRCRPEVEDQNPIAAPTNAAGSSLPARGRGRRGWRRRLARQRRDACGQRHAVEQVERIRDADQPRHRHGPRGPARAMSSQAP